jgi:hypothetical protein
MRLGTIFRKKKAFLDVYKNCASACVLVLAGGVIRSGFQWPVAIHRPYRAAVTELGAEQAQREYEARNAAIAAYLKRMNVPTALLDAMLAVPSHESRVLSEKELREYGLSESDPVYEEETNIASAKALGISISEYLGRKKARQDCLASYDASRRQSNSSPAPARQSFMAAIDVLHDTSTEMMTIRGDAAPKPESDRRGRSMLTARAR